MIVFDADEWNPSQLKFLESRSPFVLFAGGLGSGKSTAGVGKCLQLKGVNGALPGLMVAQTFGALYSNIVDPMFEVLEQALPRRKMPRIVQASKRVKRPHILWPDGCKIYLGSAELPKGYDGLNVAWNYGDELRYWLRRAWETFIARRRVPAPWGQTTGTSTPAMHWMDEEFNRGKDNRELITCGTAENAANLPDDYIPGLRESYSPPMQKAMLDGKFAVLEGAVFEHFDPDPGSEWFVDWDPTPDKLNKYPVHLTVDPGYRSSAWLFICEVADLEWIVFDQMMPDRATDMLNVERVNGKRYPIDEIWCDPAGDATQSATGLDTFTILRQVRPRVKNSRILRTIEGFSSIEFGIDKLRVLIGGEEGLRPRIRFAKRLLKLEEKQPRGIIRDLSRLVYPTRRDGRALTEKPEKDGVTDHSTDALRYYAVGRWMVKPMLRNKDPDLRKSKKPGYRVA